ncbi:MAG TPA: 50S ribosomal protein L24 [Clostridiales bacterium]|nr:50S ribosomal protein L24 [Clostridiales bacterium]HPV02338.1 50S ribosomal protein L24 [Clostridiales bacterium]
MANKVHVKTGDIVYVLSGKDKGKKGKVLAVNPDDMTVIVEGVNITKKHRKPRGRLQEGGIISQESPISSSKVMLVCTRCKSPTKISRVIRENGQKDRVCKRCGEVIDTQKEAKEE